MVVFGRPTVFVSLREQIDDIQYRTLLKPCASVPIAKTDGVTKRTLQNVSFLGSNVPID
jgi:hypothetical protein